VFGEALPAIISGTFAALVAVVAAFLSYWFGKRTLRQQLTDKVQEIGASGLQDRITAEREYQLEAMKTFRATVGGPKGQIIQSVHDLSDRLRAILQPEEGVATDRWVLLSKSDPYRRTTFWLILKPFVWINILRGQMVFLDQTLGDLVEGEFRFLNYCRLLERALTERTLFQGTDYQWPEVAQVFYNQLQFINEQLTADSGTASISYSEFMKARPTTEVQGVMEFLQNAGARGRLGELRRARLIALYTASNFFLERFRLPYRQFETAEESLMYFDAISPARGTPIRENLQKLLSEHANLSPSAT
jgi:hypothetical protein